VLTGSEVGAEGLLETSVAGIYAAGDVALRLDQALCDRGRRRCVVVRLVHDRLSAVAV